MKKGIIIGIVIGLIIGLICGIVIGKNTNSNNSSNDNPKEVEKEKSSLNEYDQKFIGKWEYGTKYEEMEGKLNTALNNYKEKYELRSSEQGCLYGDKYNSSYIAEAHESNITLLINKDGTVEYTTYSGLINDKCEVQIATGAHYKGTFENSKIVFKKSETNGEWKEIRQTHNIYLEDDETLHYKVVDENPKSATYLFIKRN